MAQESSTLSARLDSAEYLTPSEKLGSSQDIERFKQEQTVEGNTTEDEEVFPEGTLWGWMAVLGGFALSVSTFGFILSWGTFQAYYESVVLTHKSASDIAWIGSLQYSLIFLPGIISGRLFDAGYFRHLLAAGSLLFVAANLLIAECTQYWHFILCQGLAIGLACGMMYVPCIGVVSQWFKVKRPLAFAATSIGVSCGGVIFPFIFRDLLPKVGFKWTVRTMAFVNLAMFIIANLSMFTRIPITKRPYSMFDFSGLFTPSFTFYVMGTFVSFLGLYTFLTFVGVSALTIGFSASQAFEAVAIVNAVSAVGRMGGGLCALKFGPVNALIFFSAGAAICTYVWPYVTLHSGFYAVICFYGITSGAFVALFPAGVASLGSFSDLGRRAGALMSIMALGALAGPPISGAIVRTKHSFRPVGAYAGTMIILSVILMIISRYTALKRVWGGKM